MERIVICGDFRAANPGVIKMDKDVADLFERASVRICNFEAPIYTEDAKSIKKSGPSLYQSVEAPAFTKKLGFNVILLANNHIMDYGKEGCEATIAAFDDVTTVGAGDAKDAFSVRMIDVNGKRIGLCSLVQKEFGIVEGVSDKGYGAAWINSFDVPEIIRNAKQNCDFLLVFPHAGVEHTPAPLPEWRKLYKHFIDWGADAVIASHPHCPQGWECYQGKPIYYSLGDFYFDELTYDDLWYKSIVVELSIGDTIEVKEHFVCFDDKTGHISIDNSERIREYIDYANHLLHNEEEYNLYINNMCIYRWKGIKYGLLRGLCGVSLQMRLKYIIRLLGCMLLGNKDEMYLLNVLQCESHRWVLEHYLNSNNLNKQLNETN